MISQLLNRIAKSGYVPDSVLRYGIRRLLRKRVEKINKTTIKHLEAANKDMVAKMSETPVTQLLNKKGRTQYELPPDFFVHSLGQHLNYSCALWPDGVTNLNDAEIEALSVTCQRAQIEDGMRVLELGASWGAFSLYMAQKFPNSEILSVANSQAQTEFIQSKADQLKLNNISVVHTDINEFESTKRFDRIVSIEMFEHVRYWQALFRKVAVWLDADGLFFMQIFAHKDTPYFFEEEGQSAAWMTSDYLSKGLMPSLQLPLMFGDDLVVEQHWQIPGQYYQKTANAWLQKMDDNKNSVWAEIERSRGKREAKALWVRWRLFYMSNAELFGYNNGDEWLVGQYRFCRPD